MPKMFECLNLSLEMTGIHTSAKIIQEQSSSVSSQAWALISAPYSSMNLRLFDFWYLDRDKKVGVYQRTRCD